MAYKKDTICVQGGYRPKTGESRIPPISQSTTYFYEKTQDMADLFDLKVDGYFYTRLANPTVAAFEGKVAELEGGVAGIGCSSGMAASTLLAFTVCGAGDNIVSSSAIYGGTFNLFAVTLPKLGIETRFFDPDAPAEEIEKLIDGKTKLIFTETIANPAIKILDFDKIAAIGFSAGGHLLGCISAIWDDPAIAAVLGDACAAARPDASVYGYPVVTADECEHEESFENFCRKAVKAETYSVERRVRPECSPAFIWANTPDSVVPVQNAVAKGFPSILRKLSNWTAAARETSALTNISGTEEGRRATVIRTAISPRRTKLCPRNSSRFFLERCRQSSLKNTPVMNKRTGVM